MRSGWSTGDDERTAQALAEAHDPACVAWPQRANASSAYSVLTWLKGGAGYGGAGGHGRRCHPLRPLEIDCRQLSSMEVSPLAGIPCRIPNARNLERGEGVMCAA